MLQPLTIDGAWVDSTTPNRRWHGAISVEEPHAVLLTAAFAGTIAWAKSRSRAGVGLPVDFDVHPLNLSGRTQLSLRVGDGWIQQVVVTLPSPDYIPACMAPKTLTAGDLHELFRTESEPPASFGIILLPRSSVHIGRTGVWHARDSARPALPDSLASVAAGGRTGIITESRPTKICS